MFHQVEGLCVGQGITFADLKGTLAAFARAYFGPGTRTRFRPSYFPFTEPSAEVDVSCTICGGKGGSPTATVTSAAAPARRPGGWRCSGRAWSTPGCSRTAGIDPKQNTGFAFGMGVERLAMLRYGIDDLRLYFENDLRFLEQF